MFRYFTFLFISFLANLFCIAQSFNEKDFIHYTIKDGLVDNYITCLQQDEQGYMWIGTDVGLCSFDGNAFATYKPASTDRQLLSRKITRLKKISANRLGIINRNGFQILNTQNYQLSNYVIPDSTNFSTYLNYAWDAERLRDGSFAVTSSTGFYIYDSSGKLQFRYDAYKPADVAMGIIRYGRDIFSVSNHEYIIYTGVHGTAYYNAAKKIYRIVDSVKGDLRFFSRRFTPIDDYWLTTYQLSSHEFIFIKAGKDTIVYYDHTAKKNINSPMPFIGRAEINYQSKIIRLSDTSFVVNATDHGFWLFYIDRATGQIRFDPKKYLSTYRINCLFVDKEKRLWAGTPDGLLQQKLATPFLNVYSFSPLSLKDNLFGSFSCAFKYKEKLYAGRFSRNTGLAILDAATMKLIKTISFFGSNNSWNEIRSIQIYHPDTLWLGSTTGLLWLDIKTFRYGKLSDDKRFTDELGSLNLNILSPVGNDGYAWISSFFSGEVVRYHPASGTFRHFNTKTNPAVPFNRIKQVIRDSYGDTWFGGHSLARWNSRKEIFDTLITVYGGPKKFNDNILLLSADNNGSLWLHNEENGLLQYQIKEKKFIQYNMNDGLASDNLESLSPVINNTLWIAYRTRVGSFNVLEKKSVTYDYKNGLPQHKPTAAYIYYDAAGEYFYLLCKNELIKFSGTQTETEKTSSEILIQNIIINNSKTFFNPKNGIALKSGENNFVINYTVIDFESGKDYEFAYKLNKAETWTSLGNQHSINFTDLSSGKYTIQLKATSKSGQEKIKSFYFSIAPPFWKTGWFIFANTVFLAALIYFLYRYRIKQINKKANIDRLLAKTEMKALHAQMNPHFVFNSLNSIMEMVLNDEKKNASRYLSNYAHLIRLNLDHSQRTFITLRENMEYLSLYLELESIRTDSFIYSMEISGELNPDEVLMPPMLIQPFIENAIWYGPPKNKVPMKLDIFFLREKNQLICVIEDNGIGIAASQKNRSEMIAPHTPVGIANVRQRMQILNEKYKLHCSLVIEDKGNLFTSAETGTSVTLKLPLTFNDI
ncbi:MAG: histidine kinase [Chitinophagaceae bacterium]|nr:histidine kinase [Chitinophagaceae bacterium]